MTTNVSNHYLRECWIITNDSTREFLNTWSFNPYHEYLILETWGYKPNPMASWSNRAGKGIGRETNEPWVLDWRLGLAGG